MTFSLSYFLFCRRKKLQELASSHRWRYLWLNVPREFEYVQRDEPGMYITFSALTGVSRTDITRVRFSRKQFSEKETEEWWAANRVRVYEQHNISGPKLKKLTIWTGGVSNGCRVLIRKINLEYFSYAARLLDEYSFDDSSTETAELLVSSAMNAGPDFAVMNGYNLLNGLSAVKCLENLTHRRYLLENLSVFNNMTRLKVSGESISLDCKALTMIFQKSPHLENISFHSGLRIEESAVLDPVRSRCLMQVKAIEIHVFNATAEDFHVLGLLLKTCNPLKEISLYYFKHGGMKVEDLKHLRMLPRSSEFTPLQFFFTFPPPALPAR